MVTPAHIGLEHPNLIWLVAVGILAFAAGLVVNMYHSRGEAGPDADPVAEPDRDE